MKPSIRLILLTGLLVWQAARPAAAAPSADRTLPADTVAFFSIADYADFQSRWERTQLGQFTADPAMQPFVDQMRDKLINKFGNVEQRLGMTLRDVTNAAGGEVGVAMLHRSGVRASVAVVLDVTGKQAEADALVAKVERQLAKRGGARQTQTYAGQELVVFSLPANADRPRARRVVYFQQKNLLCAVDSLAYAKRMVDALVGGDAAVLADEASYAETMRRCEAESRGMAPSVRWFVAPTAWDVARRTMSNEPPVADRKDTATILREQGFDAVKGIGGHVALAVNPQQDMVHRTAVLAPGKPGAVAARDKYRLAMRMLELPNRPVMPVQEWAPRMTATYTTVNIDLLNLFDHVPSLFDAMTGYEGAFRTTLDSFEIDRYGPQIKVRDQLIANLGTRVTMMTDYKMPITPDCERYLFVVEVKNPDLLRSPLDKLMENDGAERREAGGVAFWEIIPEDESYASADTGDDLFSIDDTGAGEEEEESPAKERVLRRAAVCLHGDQLIIASDVEFLRQVLFGIDRRDSLAGSPDYQYAMRQLSRLASPERCSWSFYRTDESIRPSYELIRQGLMPQSQTFFGRLLNEMLTTPEDEERGIIRQQRVDGGQLPPFEMARRYFGPSARAVRTDNDGWFMTGVVLSKAGQ